MRAARAELVIPTTPPVRSSFRPNATGRNAGRPMREGRKDWQACGERKGGTGRYSQKLIDDMLTVVTLKIALRICGFTLVL
jgi:hypothetical protein